MKSDLHASRRGLTFLEMVFASALLGLVAAGAFSTIGFVGNMHKREQQSLGAAELASSIIIQYLDDKNGLPSQIAPVDYGPWQYRYTIREDRVGFRPARTGDGTAPARTLSIDRIKQVTVKVWLTEEREGGPSDSETMPGFELTRVLDPLALRNPDSF
jgi:prepilin-type N-terminal cleavage/methylation domain-containing protein